MKTQPKSRPAKSQATASPSVFAGGGENRVLNRDAIMILILAVNQIMDRLKKLEAADKGR